MGIGEKLARQRHSLGLSVEDIAATTGMSMRQVMAIESNGNQFASPPEMARMIRLYARKLGLTVDTDAIIVPADLTEAPARVTPPPIPQFLLKQTPIRPD